MSMCISYSFFCFWCVFPDSAEMTGTMGHVNRMWWLPRIPKKKVSKRLSWAPFGWKLLIKNISLKSQVHALHFLPKGIHDSGIPESLMYIFRTAQRDITGGYKSSLIFAANQRGWTKDAAKVALITSWECSMKDLGCGEYDGMLDDLGNKRWYQAELSAFTLKRPECNAFVWTSACGSINSPPTPA